MWNSKMNAKHRFGRARREKYEGRDEKGVGTARMEETRSGIKDRVERWSQNGDPHCRDLVGMETLIVET